MRLFRANCLLVCLLCCLLLPFLVSPVAAQSPSFSFSLMGGSALPNTPEWSYVASPELGVGLELLWDKSHCVERLATLSPCDSFYHRYMLGLRVDAAVPRNPIAGARFSASGVMVNPLAAWGRYSSLSWFLEFGLACYTNPYLRTPNVLNEFIGSALNCHIGLGVQYLLCLDTLRSLGFALRFAHSSNGYLCRPNQGLNYLSLEVAYRFPLLRGGAVPATLSRCDTCSWPGQSLVGSPTRRYSFFVSLAPGLVQDRGDINDRTYYFTYTCQFGALYRFSHRRALGGNIDLMYNFAYRALDIEANGPQSWPLSAGLCVTYESAWSPLFIRLSLGTYLHRLGYHTYPFYERLGAYYRFGGSLSQYVGVSMKAHYAHVDYIEWTYGINL